LKLPKNITKTKKLLNFEKKVFEKANLPFIPPYFTTTVPTETLKI